MNEPISLDKPVKAKPKLKLDVKPELKPPTRPRKPRAKKKLAKSPVSNFKHRLMWGGLELLGLAISAVLAIMVILGYSANWFSGTRFFTSLLPFAIGVLTMIVMTTGLLIGWWRLRKRLQVKSLFLSPILAVCLALVIGWHEGIFVPWWEASQRLAE
jgi:hypothetical protein